MEDRGVVLDELLKRGNPRIGLDRLGAFMHRRDRNGEFGCKAVVEFAARGQAIERFILIEAYHLDCPLDWFARAAESECAAALARDRHKATIKLRSEFAVDFKFCFACRLALFQSRKVEKWI